MRPHFSEEAIARRMRDLCPTGPYFEYLTLRTESPTRFYATWMDDAHSDTEGVEKVWPGHLVDLDEDGGCESCGHGAHFSATFEGTIAQFEVHLFGDEVELRRAFTALAPIQQAALDVLLVHTPGFELFRISDGGHQLVLTDGQTFRPFRWMPNSEKWKP